MNYPITRINCPIDVCPWHYDVPPLDPRINGDTLAGVFGPGIMAQHAANRQAETTERQLEEHLQKHTLVEWVQCIERLKLGIAARDMQLKAFYEAAP